MSRQISIKIPDDMASKFEQVKQTKEETDEEVILKALRLYMMGFSDELQKEFAGWDFLSDEAWLRFESEYL